MELEDSGCMQIQNIRGETSYFKLKSRQMTGWIDRDFRRKGGRSVKDRGRHDEYNALVTQFLNFSFLCKAPRSLAEVQ